jgi:hypothetical protein
LVRRFSRRLITHGILSVFTNDSQHSNNPHSRGERFFIRGQWILV